MKNKIAIKIIIIEKGKIKLKLVTSGKPNSTEAPLLSCANIAPIKYYRSKFCMLKVFNVSCLSISLSARAKRQTKLRINPGSQN